MEFDSDLFEAITLSLGGQSAGISSFPAPFNTGDAVTDEDGFFSLADEFFLEAGGGGATFTGRLKLLRGGSSSFGF